MGWSEAELSLTLISDRPMALLNRQTFGRRGPTNVISFPFQPTHLAGGPPPLLGEVVISLETCARQAAESGWPVEELFDFFLIHGILHLLDYDHDTPDAEDRMDKKSRELLRLLHPGIKDI